MVKSPVEKRVAEMEERAHAYLNDLRPQSLATGQLTGGMESPGYRLALDVLELAMALRSASCTK